MHLAIIRTVDGRVCAAREDGTQLVLLPWADLGALLAEPDWARNARAPAVP